MSKRKLASVQIVAEIKEIPGADRIVAYRVQDWWVVDQKDKYQVGEPVVYQEIDSLLPIGTFYDFLANRGTHKSELEDGTIVEGYRLKTIKLKGQLSQGLIIPLAQVVGAFYGSKFDEGQEVCEFFYTGADLTEFLGIHKYEKPLNTHLRGVARGNFPSFIKKTDQERCQNLRGPIWEAYVDDIAFQVSVKLDGSSMTTYITRPGPDEYLFGVCSRNLDLKETEGNAFWNVARRENLEERYISYFTEHSTFPNVAVQGELVAPNIQANFEGVTKPEFYIFSIYDICEGRYLSPGATEDIAHALSLKHVPVLHQSITLRELFPDATEDTIIKQLLEYADGPSGLNGKFREGLVYKSTVSEFSFKTISNRYLLKTGE